MFRPTQVQIDVESLQHNLERLREWSAPGSFFCPMIKDNAYGHGDVIVARAAEKMRPSALGVSMVEEGMQLREVGVQIPILVFAPLIAEATPELLKHRLTPVVGSFADLRALGSARLGVHLKCNTGMQRLGFDASEIQELKHWLTEHPNVQVEGVCTHLTHGEDAHEVNGPTHRQLQQFEKMVEGFPGVRHVHKSASLIALHTHGKTPAAGVGARPGIAVYGLPFERDPLVESLRPVLRWRSEVMRVHHVAKGQGVSYGWTWLSERESSIGVVPVGYGDGYPRLLSGRAEMLFRGHRVPVVGRVCMDYTLVDLTDATRDGAAQAGEEVVILGTQGQETITAGELAAHAETIANEIATGIQSRVPRVAVSA